ncbi:MAG TPA: sensor domain-containing diguanylate cyclase [Gemmatimonadaceae bacterium]|nr:sensor domain-containing diguanylate cyclase [Gemmatimonadaceae bacterium]
MAAKQDPTGDAPRASGQPATPARAPHSRASRSLADPETLRELTANLREGLYIATEDGRYLDANPAFLAMLGLGSVDELATYVADELVTDPARRRQELALLDREGAVREFEIEYRRPDGERCVALDTVHLRLDPETGERLYLGIAVDVTKRVELEHQLRELSMRDPLTGCFNRRHLAELERRLSADGDASWGCIFIDLDHFKQFNDRHGHQKGDDVLVKMSRFLIRQVRAEEAVVRLGGDEFLVVLEGADERRTESVARRLQLAALRTAPAAFSLGWATRLPGEPLEKTVNRADQQLLAVRVVERAPDIERRELV